MQFNESVFKAYDIRGKAPEELTPELAHAVGRALADFLPPGVVGVGRDMRSSSGSLADAVIRGLMEQGRAVMDIGLVTSDMIYFAVGYYGLAGGAMITASHDPAGDDGIKLTGQGVAPIGVDSGLGAIKAKILRDDFKQGAGLGSVEKKQIFADWVAHVAKFADSNLSKLKIAVDAGNGMAGLVFPYFERHFDLKTAELYFELDGTFPNHPANPIDSSNLRDLSAAITGQKLDAGIAFDGDGDRAFVVDEAGQPLSASVTAAILIADALANYPAAAIVYNPVLSHVVTDTIRDLGGHSVLSHVGHSFMKQKMAESGAVLGVEHSGHFYFKDNWNADSGLIAAARILDILARSGKKLSELAAAYRGRYFDSGEINFTAKNVAKILDDVAGHYSDGEQARFEGLTVSYKDWWFNLRPSNTESLLRLNVEASNQLLVKQKTDVLAELVKSQ